MRRIVLTLLYWICASLSKTLMSVSILTKYLFRLLGVLTLLTIPFSPGLQESTLPLIAFWGSLFTLEIAGYIIFRKVGKKEGYPGWFAFTKWVIVIVAVVAAVHTAGRLKSERVQRELLHHSQKYAPLP